MQSDLPTMLDRIKAGQWALADIDWDAPGAELVTQNEELYPKLKAFMADLTWIEHIGARGFAAMALKAEDPVLKEIYTYFHAEEQRHANAELALMKRWGMLEGDELPIPNTNIRLAVEWLDRYADDQPLVVLGSVIPLLEVALDGALCKFLLETVDDPLCHEVFAKINADEARHLSVDFHVLDQLGYGSVPRMTVELIGRAVRPSLIIGSLVGIPLFNKMRDNIVEMGVKEERLQYAIKRYIHMGRQGMGHRNPLFKVLSGFGMTLMDRSKTHYHKPADFLVKVSDRIPERMLPGLPSWFKELTWKTEV